MSGNHFVNSHLLTLDPFMELFITNTILVEDGSLMDEHLWETDFLFDDEVDIYITRSVSDQSEVVKHGGSRKGKLPNKNRDFAAGHDRLYNDYFNTSTVYDENDFHRRFRMPRDLFIRIMGKVSEYNPYFQQKPDAVGKMGAYCLQKCTAAVRMLAYGGAADAVDEVVRLGESTILICLKEFCSSVVNLFGEEYLREPNQDDISRLLEENKSRGFPGMLGSLDCMHWQWKNAPKAYHGQFQGKERQPTIVLEAIASYDCWIWHVFFGTPGACNDINVLQRSTLMNKILEDKPFNATYTLNGTTRSQCYWLVDGIYPKWNCFVKPFNHPEGERNKYFAKKQESCRKDIERTFGILQARFYILARPSRLWSERDMGSILNCCVILNNMNVEARRVGNENYVGILEDTVVGIEDGIGTNGDNNEESMVSIDIQPPPGSLGQLLAALSLVKNDVEHFKLRDDLIHHLWEFKGSQSTN